MDQSVLRQLATEFLCPLFSGSQIAADPVPSGRRDGLAAFVAPCKIEFKAEASDPYRLVLTRSQPFVRHTAGQVVEIDVVNAFVQVVGAMKDGLNSWYHADLHATFPRRVVAKSLCQTQVAEKVLLTAIDQLSDWAGRQYEGKAIPAALGFVPGTERGATSLEAICKEDFSAVMSNGYDTLLACNLQGEVLGHESLNPPPEIPSFAPYRLAAIANWATSGRTAITLNRAGEILVFQNQELIFARRASRWHFLTHDQILTQMRRPESLGIRRALYESCLDASFARTGACLGVVLRSQHSKWKQVATKPDDYLTSASPKASAIARMVNGRPFYALDRRLRQELLAIDGATLVHNSGEILAVGAILRIEGGSTGGGRLAAAKALSKLGVGIKVSQDGGIQAYDNEKLKFSLMR